MTKTFNNGLAVSKVDPLGRDYWHNGTSCSGYSFDGYVIGRVLNRFIDYRHEWTKGRYLDYSPNQVLAVPEQLVWWEC